MSAPAELGAAGIRRRFRVRLLLAMMLAILLLASLGIYVAQARSAAAAQSRFQHDFHSEIAALDRLQALRNSALLERSRALAQNARIHAALEDNALDLLYPSARADLQDLLERPGRNEVLHARFYRFLDAQGRVIPPPHDSDAGTLSAAEEAQLALSALPAAMQIGYLARGSGSVSLGIDELMALPIASTETGETISALVLGFAPAGAAERTSTVGMKSGVLVQGKIELPGVTLDAARQIVGAVERAAAKARGEERSFPTTIGGAPFLLFCKALNPHSAYPPAEEICLYPLQPLFARQRELRWQIVGLGGLVVAGGLVISGFVSQRLSRPVEELAVVSEENLAQRQRAEAALQTTSEDLQRTARFSADASHQLKSPITVLRAGLDSLLAREGFPPEVYEELSQLVHQTYRLTGVIEHLLLLARVDAGKLQIDLQRLELSQIVEELIDDLRTFPGAEDLRVECEVAPGLHILGDRDYVSLIVQNLLENARKYNHPGGTICVAAAQPDGSLALSVRNTGPGIPRAAQSLVFERFQRADAREEIAGHGLGLNLARELIRLQQGELRLVRSDSEWTEFVAMFRAAPGAVA